MKCINYIGYTVPMYGDDPTKFKLDLLERNSPRLAVYRDRGDAVSRAHTLLAEYHAAAATGKMDIYKPSADVLLVTPCPSNPSNVVINCPAGVRLLDGERVHLISAGDAFVRATPKVSVEVVHVFHDDIYRRPDAIQKPFMAFLVVNHQVLMSAASETEIKNLKLVASKLSFDSGIYGESDLLVGPYLSLAEITKRAVGDWSRSTVIRSPDEKIVLRESKSTCGSAVLRLEKAGSTYFITDTESPVPLISEEIGTLSDFSRTEVELYFNARVIELEELNGLHMVEVNVNELSSEKQVSQSMAFC